MLIANVAEPDSLASSPSLMVSLSNHEPRTTFMQNLFKSKIPGFWPEDL